MKQSFSIDLVICTYNNAALLRQTLQGLAALQSPPHLDWGVLVVNNNCTDDTEEVVDWFRRHTTLELDSVTETEQGVATARFCGVKNTRRDWVAFIDDDCVLQENWLTEAERFLAARPRCGVFGSRIRLVFDREPEPFVHCYPFAYAGKNHGDVPKRMSAVAGAGMVVRRKLLHDCGWMDYRVLADRKGGELTSGGDMELALRVGTLSEVWYNPFCSINHLIPERRTTKPYLRRMLHGLGASRHHTAALLWRRSYSLWFLYSLAYAFGMLGLCCSNALYSGRRQAGYRVVFAPFRGWCAGIVDLWRMPVAQRKILLGCAVAKRSAHSFPVPPLTAEAVVENSTL